MWEKASFSAEDIATLPSGMKPPIMYVSEVWCLKMVSSGL